jgi:hypothetical protein
VYHPTPGTGNGHAFANIGWSVFIGTLTGLSSVQVTTLSRRRRRD